MHSQMHYLSWPGWVALAAGSFIAAIGLPLRINARLGRTFELRVLEDLAAGADELVVLVPGFTLGPTGKLAKAVREAGNFFCMQVPMKIRPVLALVGLLLATGCGDSAKEEYGDAFKPYAALDQKWSKETAEHFWWTSQGSQIVPYDGFLALEMPDSQELFSGNAHFERLRYITVTGRSAKNPGGLPIGFVK